IFIHKRRNGVIFYNKDDCNLRRLTDGYKGKRISFGSSGNCDFYPMSIKENGLSQEFICFKKKKKLGNVYINIPGRHNVFNALTAISCGLEFGLEFDKMRDILSTFQGVKRRFEIKAGVNDIILVEDYAHHPTAIKAVIGTASKLDRKRVIVIFQPHRFTRTVYLEKEFSKAFNDVDKLILTDIYAANEDPIEGVSIKNIYNGVKKEGSKSVKTLPKDEIAPYLKKIVRSGDIILVLGAGDINGIIPDIEKFLKRKI
ncbi:MAG: UDP-N-acetylmuramate--L-alanine ligase, partial [Candidatus Omnitrophica bacterium]|nr:UDP-N-acetylmuramate--L-alanine ligase [Candidatus Omnitrophota bacterium]